ncbi:glycerophosphodiester phosphodiesterase domain-containing protein 5 isoform X2 [Denticeps clupeoides]|uniref:glycerophosphodiester phosphodiesterase domain-containing protein 5 isoform X2 n=1 Tax=Denticeps clupeoides TaxID=299321 RepID=UPI0010A46DAF|nr:glycerophosphodiester phosphodiesterase domain-containing protein 5-like isoform X2 [Denticeps clupeoides]
MVKHQPLQVYERQLCLSCLTGIYGCRWKRYQRSHDDTTIWESTWFFLLCCSFFLLLVWSYFWWEAQNDYNEFNWLLYNRSGEWSDGILPILISTVVCFTYTAFLMVLALCHIALGQQLNLYWLHKIGVLAVFIATITGVVSIDNLWRNEWDIVLISLQFTGPFLHIVALAAVTALGWLVAGLVVRGERSRFQMGLLLLYLLVLLALYLAPLTITSPCLMDRSSLQPRPTVTGRRGSPMLAPENTLMSFNKALQHGVSALEADVAISLEGVPFLMRDRTLKRTTDVGRLFPERQADDASLFNWTELRSLNSGLWFLKEDPFGTVSSMTTRERNRVGNQSVCSLAELLRLALRANCSVIFSLRRPPLQHPRHHFWINDTLRTVQKSRIPLSKVMWTPDSEREKVQREAPQLQQTSQEKLPMLQLQQRGITALTLHYSQAQDPDIRQFLKRNVSLNVYTVNEPWLFSVLWCSGVSSVSSEAPHILRKVPFPIWTMSPEGYCLIWIAADLVSFAVIVGTFLYQKWKASGMRSYNPEQIMLSAVVRRPSRNVNIMKEKLIFSEVNSDVGSTDELSLYTENGYDRYTHGTLGQSDHF